MPFRAAGPGVEAPPLSDPGEALAAARTWYAIRNPASAGAYERACAAMPGGNTRTVLHVDPFPLYFAHAEGAALTDLDGHRYDDFLGEYTAGVFGHSDPLIRSTLQETSAAGLNFGGHSEHEARFAALLVERFPALEMVRFTNSGTEANLMALGAARVFTGRDRVLAFSGAYHGGVLGFKAATRINAPFDVVLGVYNDVEGARALLRSQGAEFAAVLVEPMLQSGGCIPATEEFLRALRQESEASGALLIFDEVVTSRLHPGGVHGHLGLKPDLVTLGKYMGGGLSFGAFGGRREIMRMFDPRSPDSVPHAGTFNNNTLTMAVGHAAMAHIFTPQAAIALNRRGAALRETLNGLVAAAQAPMQFTGAGSIMCVHMTAAPIAAAEHVAAGDPALRELFYFHLLERGLYIARRGMISLSLAVSDDQIARLVEGVSSFLETYRTLVLSARSGA